MINEYLAKSYCKDDISKIENYEQAIADQSQTWDIHHRIELHSDGSVRFTRKSLIKIDLYYNRPARELIFLTHTEHISMHHKGKKLSDEIRQKLSKPHSAEWCAKLAESHKGLSHTDETRKKISEANYKRWAKWREQKV